MGNSDFIKVPSEMEIANQMLIDLNDRIDNVGIHELRNEIFGRTTGELVDLRFIRVLEELQSEGLITEHKSSTGNPYSKLVIYYYSISAKGSKLCRSSAILFKKEPYRSYLFKTYIDNIINKTGPFWVSILALIVSIIALCTG
jgi:hypothetical protein